MDAWAASHTPREATNTPDVYATCVAAQPASRQCGGERACVCQGIGSPACQHVLGCMLLPPCWHLHHPALSLSALRPPLVRRKLPERKPPTAAANAPNKNKEERLQGILQHRNINIKVSLRGTGTHTARTSL